MIPVLSDEHKAYIREKTKEKRTVSALRAAIILLFFLLWEAFTRIGVLDPFIFSSPSRAFRCLYRMSLDGTIFRHAAVTFCEAAVGFLAGTVCGILIAMLLWWFPRAEKVLDPYLVVINSLPKIALGPVIIVWVGSGYSSILTVTLLVSVVCTVIGVLSGFREVDEEKLTLLRRFGAKKRQLFAYAVFPASIPAVISALKINVGMTWVGVIVGEFLVSRSGLGYLIVYGGQVFRMDLVMGSVLILCALAGVMYYAVGFAEKKAKRFLAD